MIVVADWDLKTSICHYNKIKKSHPYKKTHAKKIIFIVLLITDKILSYEYDQITSFFLKYQAPTKIAYLLNTIKKELMVDESQKTTAQKAIITKKL